MSLSSHLTGNLNLGHPLKPCPLASLLKQFQTVGSLTKNCRGTEAVSVLCSSYWSVSNHHSGARGNHAFPDFEEVSIPWVFLPHKLILTSLT